MLPTIFAILKFWWPWKGPVGSFEGWWISDESWCSVGAPVHLQLLVELLPEILLPEVSNFGPRGAECTLETKDLRSLLTRQRVQIEELTIIDLSRGWWHLRGVFRRTELDVGTTHSLTHWLTLDLIYKQLQPRDKNRKWSYRPLTDYTLAARISVLVQDWCLSSSLGNT